MLLKKHEDRHRKLLDFEERISHIGAASTASQASSRSSGPLSPLSPSFLSKSAGGRQNDGSSSCASTAASLGRRSVCSGHSASVASSGGRSAVCEERPHSKSRSQPFLATAPLPATPSRRGLQESFPARPRSASASRSRSRSASRSLSRGRLQPMAPVDHLQQQQRSAFNWRPPAEQSSRLSDLMNEPEFRALCNVVGGKVAARFKSIKRCFAFVERDSSRMIDIDKMRAFFFSFALPPDVADRFFNYLDFSGDGLVRVEDLRWILSSYIQPGYTLPKAPPSRRPGSARGARGDRQELLELEHVCSMVGAKAHQKWKLPRDCFWKMDENKDGKICRDECARFVMQLNFPRSVGDRIFNILARRSDGETEDAIDYATFCDVLAPYIRPGYGRSDGLQARVLGRDASVDSLRERRPRSLSPLAASSSLHPRPLNPELAAVQRRKSRRPSVASLASASTGSGGASHPGFGLLRDEVSQQSRFQETDMPGSLWRSAGALGGTTSPQHRSEVFHGLRGDVCLVKDVPNCRFSRTTDSAKVRCLLQGSDDGGGMSHNFPIAHSKSWQGPFMVAPREIRHDYDDAPEPGLEPLTPASRAVACAPPPPTAPRPASSGGGRRQQHERLMQRASAEPSQEAQQQTLISTDHLPLGLARRLDRLQQSSFSASASARRRSRPRSAGPTMSRRDGGRPYYARPGCSRGREYHDYSGAVIYDPFAAEPQASLPQVLGPGSVL
eukprot:TRINITY_DN82068_c0_g1_i1.p1 TRINITY_DN82068_c0_g1~~TRINITY_DN82068_c0_g1_i1.p1  ORF type:complete len:728 (+),score=61.73 TRINITY_DN82068_c0_g1_i1:157-2340(+)